jgi:4'-phosphopantetheinyl transferase
MHHVSFADAFAGLPDEIDVEFLRPEYGAVAELTQLLSDAELERAASFGSERRRNTFTLGRAAARLLLARRLGVEPRSIGLAVAEDGAVDVLGHPLHLSISHTEEAAVAAVSPRPIGIDIEPIRQRVADLYTYVLHPEEHGLLKGVEDVNGLTLRAWVVKESVLKATRVGLRRSPKDVRLAYDVDGSGVARLPEGDAWQFLYVEREGFVSSIAFPLD